MPDVLAVVQDVVTAALGPVATVERLQTWGPTVVAAVALVAGQQLVLKASAHHDVGVEEVTARLAWAAGVPGPDILADGVDERLPGGRWFVMTRLPGVPWSTLDPEPGRDHLVLSQIGAALAALHRVSLPGFGPLAIDGTGSTGSWSGWLDAEFHRCLDTVRGSGSGLDLDKVWADARRALGDETGASGTALLHGDLGDGEIYVEPDGDRVSGIVDWGDSLVGDPRYEFSRFVAGGPADDPRPARMLPTLITAYNAVALRRYARGPVTDLYDAHNAVRNAAWSVREGIDWTGPLVGRARNLLTGLTV